MAKQVIASTRPCGFCRLGVCLSPGILSARSINAPGESVHERNRRRFCGPTSKKKRQQQHERWALLFYIDVDDLKSTNDSAGHAAGDSLLTRTAQALRSVFRDTDVIGRLSGDEFAALVTVSDPNACDLMLHRLQGAIAADNLARAEASLSLSVGFAQFNPRKPSSMADLLRKADVAMYEDKLAKLARPEHKVRAALHG
ncbi:MAG: GGDEF domain-containing protein [Gammaproteobacteria bacterium]|nr:MAG: GGDEF domain-containing protein [Gammaproteobacteria bacterium]